MDVENLPHSAGVSLSLSAVNSVPMSELLDLASRFGSVFVRNTGMDSEAFYQATEELPIAFMDYRGGAFERKSIDGNSTLLSVTGEEKGYPIPLHGELYYQKRQPDFLIFYCKKKALLGGSSTVASAAQIFASLSQEAKEFLTTRKLRYTRRLSVSEWPRVYQTHDKDSVKATCEELGLTHHFEDSGELVTEFITSGVRDSGYLNNLLPNYFLQKLGRPEAGISDEEGRMIPESVMKSIIKSCKQNRVKLQMKPGDMLFVNNRTTLHGRTGYIGNRKIFLRMGSKES
jgi:alpha-ketoglutarate-dependent taurine dioxygenase